MSPEERDLTKLVDDHGGPDVVMRNESLLREIFESRTTGSGAGISAPERKTRHGGAVVDEFRELQRELQEDVQTAVRENMEQFQAKFVIQQRELEENLRRAMHREGDRIIDAVISGPHDKILDPVSRYSHRRFCYSLTAVRRISMRFGRRWYVRTCRSS